MDELYLIDTRLCHKLNIISIFNNCIFTLSPYLEFCWYGIVYVVAFALPLLCSGSCQSVLVLFSSQVQLNQ